MATPRCDPTESPQLEPKCRDPKCRVCGSTGEVQKLMFGGRYRTRVEIARWYIGRREWKGAQIAAGGSSVYFRKGQAFMRLDHFSPEEIAALKIRILKP